MQKIQNQADFHFSRHQVGSVAKREYNGFEARIDLQEESKVQGYSNSMTDIDRFHGPV